MFSFSSHPAYDYPTLVPTGSFWQMVSTHDNGKQGKRERFVQGQYSLAEKCFSRNVIYIPPMSDSSL